MVFSGDNQRHFTTTCDGGETWDESSWTYVCGRGMTASLQYMGSRLEGIVYALPNGGTFTSAFTRSPSRPDLITRRDYRFGAGSIYWYETGYDLAGRPTNAVDSISIARTYLYNRRSELAAAQIGTNSFSYVYDTIGDRIWSSANSYTNSYAANCLNQYSSISTLRASASPREINPSYDADGNLVQDDRNLYSYDAENRLISAVPRIPVEGSFAVENRYNHKNLRVRKIVRRYTDGGWADYATHDFTYDGGNIVLERITFADGSTRTVEYFWGNDLSGTEQGAGGVGGLVAVSVDGLFYIPCYDHNGNIVCYVSESGMIAAQYVYDPYDNVVEAIGSNTDLFSFGFSTKYHDREVYLMGYQYRIYHPVNGRWLNRDPIEEKGGENLYAFCGNDPVGKIDLMGCGTCKFGMPSPAGNFPEFSVSYELDSKERKRCNELKVLRYVRKFLTGGQIGPYVLDGTAFEAKCTKGPWSGKILSKQTKPLVS